MKKIQYIFLLLLLSMGALTASAETIVRDTVPGIRTDKYDCSDNDFYLEDRLIIRSGEYYTFHSDTTWVESLPTDPIDPEPEGEEEEEEEEEKGENEEVELTMHITVYTDTVEVHLNTVEPTIIYENICEGAEYQMPTGELCTTKGIYRDTLLSQNGCDSIIVLYLNVYAPYEKYDTLYLSYKDMPYTWQDMELTEAGDYDTTYTCIHGCDSTYYLHLEVATNFVYTEWKTFCMSEQQESFLWRGQSLSQTGVYYDSLRTVDGLEDSVYVLHLFVPPIYHTKEIIEVCEGQTAQYHGTKFTESGLYTFHLTSIYGCDSVVDVSVVINPAFHQYDTLYYADRNPDVLGKKPSWTWHKQDYTELKEQTDPFKRESNECDSIYHLTIAACLQQTIKTVCQNDLPYRWKGNEYTDTGIYYYVVEKANRNNHFDSIYRLDLTVKMATDTTIHLELPDGRYKYEDLTFSSSGTYTTTITNKIGCDSVVTLSVAIQDMVRHDTIGVGQEYIWHPHDGEPVTLTKENLYTRVIPVPRGLTYEGKTTPGDTLWLTVLDTITRTYSDTICEEQLLNKKPYLIGSKEHWGHWDGKHYKDSTYLSYDRHHTFTLHVLPARRCTTTYTICQGEFVERILFNGNHVKYTEPGDYVDYIPPTTGTLQCDSVDVYHVIVIKPTITKKQLDTDKDMPYTWRGQTITCAGIYTDTVRSNQGCSAVHILEATTITQRAYTICQGDSLKFIDRFLYTEGNHDYTYTSKSGLDSILRWNVHILPAYHLENVDHIADTARTYTWIAKDNNKQVVRTKTFNFSTPNDLQLLHDTIHFTSANGCDNTIALTLHIHPTHHIEENIEVCPSELPYDWHGKALQSSGTYIDSLKTETWHYDSVHVLHFTVLPIAEKHFTYMVCKGETVTHNDKTYSTSGFFTDILTAANGCDSIETIEIKWLDTYFSSSAADISDKQLPYTWHVGDKDSLLYQEGTFTKTLTAANGCDSVVEFRLYVHPTYKITDHPISVCPSELPYSWRGKELKTTGTYQANFNTKTWGYDSIYVVDFTVLPAYITDTVYYVCAGEHVIRNNKEYTERGFYSDVLRAQNGCDSIDRFEIRWRETFFTPLTAHCSNQETYTWHIGDKDSILTHSGVYRETLTSVLTQCDSVVELTLTVHPTYHFSESKTLCEADLPYTWHGQELWTSGTYTDEQKTKFYQYDSIYTLEFTVLDTAMTYHYIELCHGEEIVYDGHRFSESGVWIDSLSNQLGCDSIVTYRINVLPVYGSHETASTRKDEPYIWHGLSLTQTGTYSYPDQAQNGCDSILTLYLQVYDNEYLKPTETQEICSSLLPYEWRGHTYSATNVYYDTIHGLTDTIYTLDLKVLPVEHEVIDQVLCEGEQFDFNGLTITRDTLFTQLVQTGSSCEKKYTVFIRFRKHSVHNSTVRTSDVTPYLWDVNNQLYTSSGLYTHTVRTKDDKCDSITHMLDLRRTHYETIPVLLCQGETYTFRGRVYTTDSYFMDTITASECDTIRRMEISFRPTNEKAFTVDISDKETYNFHGTLYSESGDYVYSEPNKYGCDSVERLTLRVHPTYYIEESLSTCANEPVFWQNNWYDKTDTYTMQYYTKTWGYDSIRVLHLTVYPTYELDSTVYINPGETLTINGLTIKRPGTYVDSLQTLTYGCDSVVRYIVNYHNRPTVVHYDTICEGDVFPFYGEELTTSGVYRHIRPEDRVEDVCHLHVHPQIINEERVVLYEGQAYQYLGYTYYAPRVVEFHAASAITGCDSIYRLNLIESQHCSDWDNIPLCTGGSVQIDAMTITEPGSYTFLRRSLVSGELDSLYRVHVYAAKAYDLPMEYYEICSGDSLPWNGAYYKRKGTFVYRGTTANGCDSIAHMTLTVHPKYQFYTDAAIADYESYTWKENNLVYTGSGNYNIEHSTIHGCDSIYTLRLTVVPTTRVQLIDTMCVSGSYAWRGKVYTKPGFYSDTLYSPGSGVSTIYTLELHEERPTTITEASIGDICADQDQFIVRFEYTGAPPKTYSVTFDAVGRRNGFVNVIDEPYRGEIIVPMPERSISIYQGHGDFVRPDNYRLRVTVDNGVCGIAMTDTLIVQVRYPSWIIEQTWYNVVTPLKAENNGGFHFSQYEWYVNGTKFDTHGLGYIYSNDLKEGDQVVLYAYRRGENYAIPTCPLTIEHPAPIVYDNPQIDITPNVVSRHMPQVMLRTNEAGTWTIYGPTGQLITSGAFHAGEEKITLPAVEGCYLIHTLTGSNTPTTHKVLVY